MNDGQFVVVDLEEKTAEGTFPTYEAASDYIDSAYDDHNTDGIVIMEIIPVF